MNLKKALFAVFLAFIGLSLTPCQSLAVNVTVMADPATGALKAPLAFFSQNILPGTNITITTNLVTGQVTINSSGAAGGGTASNVYFFPSTFATWSLTNGGSNIVTIIGLQPASDNLTNFSRLSTNAFDTSGKWQQSTNGNNLGSGWAGLPTNSVAMTNKMVPLGSIKTGEFVYVDNSGGTNLSSTLNLGNGTNVANAPISIAGSNISISNSTNPTTGKITQTISSSGVGGGSSPMVCSNILVQQTNEIIWDIKTVQHLTLMLNTNLHRLTISNAPAVTNSPSGIAQLDTWEDTVGGWKILSTNVSGGLLRTYGGWIRGTGSNQYDTLTLKLDGTLTNLLGRWDTNAQPVTSYTNTLAGGGGGGGGGGTWTLVASTAKQGTSGNTTTDPIDITTANLVVVDLVWSGGSPSTVSDSTSDTFVTATNSTTGGGNPKIESDYVINPTTSSSYTVTAAFAGVAPSIHVYAWKKTGGTPVFDTVSDANRTDLSGVASANWHTTPTKTGSLTAPAADYLFMSAAAWDGSSATPSNDSSFTMPNSPTFNGGGIQTGYLITTGSASENVGWTGANSVDATSNIKMFH